MSISEGDEFLKKGDKQIGKLFFNDPDAAYEFYIKGAGCYKAAKAWAKAGDAFSKAADLAIKNKDNFQAVQGYTEAAKMYQKVDTNKANVVLQQAIKLNIEQNRLGAAARLVKEHADALDAEGRGADALEHYKKAAEYFAAENQPSSEAGCLKAQAKILGELDRFAEAGQVNEALGQAAAAGPLKRQATDFFFKAFICKLACAAAGDNTMEAMSDVEEALARYQVIDNYLRNTRELQVMEGLLEAVEGSNEEKFDEVMGMLSELRMLDEWKAHVLVAVRKSLDSAC